MSDHYWLTEVQIERLKPCFPRSHGVPKVDDRRVLSGIIHVIKRGLQWRDAPAEYGPHMEKGPWPPMGPRKPDDASTTASNAGVKWGYSIIYSKSYPRNVFPNIYR